MKKIESPCRIGDEIYRVTSDLQIKSLTVTGIQISDKASYVSCQQNRSVVTVPFERFGTEVFNSKSQAKRYIARKLNQENIGGNYNE